jgi:hypothetical protein
MPPILPLCDLRDFATFAVEVLRLHAMRLPADCFHLPLHLDA